MSGRKARLGADWRGGRMIAGGRRSSSKRPRHQQSTSTPGSRTNRLAFFNIPIPHPVSNLLPPPSSLCFSNPHSFTVSPLPTYFRLHAIDRASCPFDILGRAILYLQQNTRNNNHIPTTALSRSSKGPSTHPHPSTIQYQPPRCPLVLT